ncbi:MAG: TVP38/TMEM64 family protein [Pseudoramibacter sp.]
MNHSFKSFMHKYWKNLVLFAALAIFVWMIYIAFGNAAKSFPMLVKLLQKGDEKQIAAYLQRQGRWRGYITIVLFSIIQVISIVFPGMAIQVAAGLIYRWWTAFILCYIGFVAGNCMVFIFARKIGKRFSERFALGRKISNYFNKKTSNSWIMGKINSANPEFVFGMACLIPGIPNGIIPYLASSTRISAVGFGAAVAASSWIQIILNCLAGSFLIRGKYFFVVLSFAAQIVLILFMLWKKDWFLSKM